MLFGKKLTGSVFGVPPYVEYHKNFTEVVIFQHYIFRAKLISLMRIVFKVSGVAIDAANLVAIKYGFDFEFIPAREDVAYDFVTFEILGATGDVIYSYTVPTYESFYAVQLGQF